MNLDGRSVAFLSGLIDDLAEGRQPSLESNGPPGGAIYVLQAAAIVATLKCAPFRSASAPGGGEAMETPISPMPPLGNWWAIGNDGVRFSINLAPIEFSHQGGTVTATVPPGTIDTFVLFDDGSGHKVRHHCVVDEAPDGDRADPVERTRQLALVTLWSGLNSALLKHWAPVQKLAERAEIEVLNRVQRLESRERLDRDGEALR